MSSLGQDSQCFIHYFKKQHQWHHCKQVCHPAWFYINKNTKEGFRSSLQNTTNHAFFSKHSDLKDKYKVQNKTSCFRERSKISTTTNNEGMTTEKSISPGDMRTIFWEELFSTGRAWSPWPGQQQNWRKTLRPRLRFPSNRVFFPGNITEPDT